MKSAEEINAQFELMIPNFLTVSMLDRMDINRRFVEMEAGGAEKYPKDSFKASHDPDKIDYLLRNGVRVPSEWYATVAPGDYRPSERYRTYKEFHAEIVTATIILDRLRDIFALVKENITSEDLRVELEYHVEKLLNHRVDLEGDRDPDVTGRFKNREARMKSLDIPCNPEARLSLDELVEVRNIILDSFKD